MSNPSPNRLISTILALATIVSMVGCAGIPRIDPSGRSFFIPPNPADPSTQTTLVSPFGSAPGPSSSNQLAPPAYSGSDPWCPLCPICPLGNCNCFGGDRPTPVANAVTSVARKPAETLTITPEKILAPIGSEVILKASVCGENNYLRTNRRVEWMLGANGAGQFVTVGEQGEMDFMRFPWQRPNKHDNLYAVGYTSPFHTCINRGTPDRSDDVQIRPGDAWITVTSASEGVSFVTASAPETANWDTRRSQAMIYWVDAEWVLPPSTSVQLGQPHTLVTTVKRQSDGAPVSGWVVKYEVLEGPTARLGYESGQVSEATTDAQGRANMQVSPTDDQPGMARVKVTVIRPAQSGAMPSPELEVGGGEVVIDWTPTASVIETPQPSLEDQGGITPPAPFEPAPVRPTPPRDSSGKPELEVTVRRDTRGIIKQQDSIPVTITVRNTGNAVARNIGIVDKFDPGLTSPFDTDKIGKITYPSFPDLQPGESDIARLELQAISPGRQCHEVTVTADGAESAFDRQCFDVEQPPAPQPPRLSVASQGEIRREVGQIYELRTRVTNSGSVAAKNLKVEVLYDGPLKPEEAEQGYQEQSNGFKWEIAEIAPGESRPFNVKFKCLRPTRAAKLTVYVNADGISEQIKNNSVEITEASGVGPLGGTTDPAPAASPLTGSITSNATSRVGLPGTFDIVLTNRSSQALQNLQFRVVDTGNRISMKLTPAQSNIPFQVNSNSLEFGPITQLPANQSVRITVPYDGVSQGTTALVLQAKLSDGSTPQLSEFNLTVEPR